MRNAIATAPVSYGVFELTVDGAGLPEPDALLTAMASSGYVGTELGPPGYLGDGAEVGERLASHGLTLVASFLPLRFSRREHVDDDLVGLDRALALLEAAAAAGDQSTLPAVLLSDGFCEPERLAFAGQIEAHRETWLPKARQELLAANVSRAAERCRARGFAVSFHHHAGTYVETPREVSALFDRVDPALVGLCFDTGHCAFGGGDTVAFLREYGEIVTHVHVKDVDLSLLERLHRRGAGLEEAWASGAFCELGTGGAAVPECLTELERLGYDGWIVVEQDRILAPGTPWSEVVDSGARNRAWLRDHGFE